MLSWIVHLRTTDFFICAVYSNYKRKLLWFLFFSIFRTGIGYNELIIFQLYKINNRHWHTYNCNVFIILFSIIILYNIQEMHFSETYRRESECRAIFSFNYIVKFMTHCWKKLFLRALLKSTDLSPLVCNYHEIYLFIFFFLSSH